MAIQGANIRKTDPNDIHKNQQMGTRIWTPEFQWQPERGPAADAEPSDKHYIPKDLLYGSCASKRQQITDFQGDGLKYVSRRIKSDP